MMQKRLIDAPRLVIKLAGRVRPLLQQGVPAIDIYNATLDVIGKAPEVDPTTEWIPVRERMPKEGERVLAFYQDGFQRVLSTDIFGFPLVHTKDLKWVLATHWMPLPDPPKEGK